MNWLQKISQSVNLSLGGYPDRLKKHLYDLSDSSMERDTEFPYTRQDANESIASLLQETEQNMQYIVRVIQSALSNINFQSSVTVRPARPPSESFWGEDYTKPVSDAYITVGHPTSWGGAAEFTLFIDGDRIEVDDILEAGDTDFFTDSSIESDYFNLVRELKNPGANRSSRIITLYTARPTKDRLLYMAATTVPSNLFLSNSYNHVEGLARDLSTGGMRDIWKVRIEEKYLLTTLDTGNLKEYQIAGHASAVPVRSITLISPGEEV